MIKAAKVLALISAIVGPAAASGQTYIEPVRIVRLAVDKGGTVFLRASKRAPYATTPACASNTEWDFVFSLSEPGCQGMLAAALSAKGASPSLRLVGSASCSHNFEQLYVIDFLEQ